MTNFDPVDSSSFHNESSTHVTHAADLGSTVLPAPMLDACFAWQGDADTVMPFAIGTTTFFVRKLSRYRPAHVRSSTAFCPFGHRLQQSLKSLTDRNLTDVRPESDQKLKQIEEQDGACKHVRVAARRGSFSQQGWAR